MTPPSLSFFSRTLRAALVVALVFSLVGCPGPKPQEFKNPMLGYLKVPPPKVLARKSTTLINQLDSTGQVGLFLPFLLAGYGHPSYSGFDEEANITVFFLRGETLEKPDLIALAKAEPGTRLLDQLVPQLKLTTREWGPWIALVQDESVFDRIVSQKELVRIAEEAALYDLQLSLVPAVLEKERADIMEDALARISQADSPQAEQWAAALINLFFNELESAHSLTIGGNIDQEAIGYGMDLEALRGTALAAFIQEGSKGRVDGGRFLPAGETVQYIVDFPADAMGDYLDHLLNQLEKDLPPGSGLDFNALRENLNEYHESWSGLGGGSYSVDADGVRFAQILDGDFKPAFAEAILGLLFGMLTEASVTQDPGDGTGPLELDFKLNAGEIDGVSYHHFRQQTLPPDSVPEGMEAFSEQEIFIAVADGNLIQVGSVEDLDRLIQSIRRGKPTGDALETVFARTPGTWFQGELDLVRYYLQTSTALPGDALSSMVNPRDLRRAFQGLIDEDLKPVRMVAKNEGPRLSFQLELPLATLKTIIREFQSLEPEPRSPEAPDWETYDPEPESGDVGSSRSTPTRP